MRANYKIVLLTKLPTFSWVLDYFWTVITKGNNLLYRVKMLMCFKSSKYTCGPQCGRLHFFVKIAFTLEKWSVKICSSRQFYEKLLPYRIWIRNYTINCPFVFVFHGKTTPIKSLSELESTFQSKEEELFYVNLLTAELPSVRVHDFAGFMVDLKVSLYNIQHPL